MVEAFSEILKHERKAQGMSQRQIAEKLGIAQSTYMHYELIGTKHGREPSFQMLYKICEVLNVSLDYLFGLED
ncbi:MAG: helix-turn-helix domain-containing protein [Firmicutes bacterium]|nr:helix-turn-helix domain-containing protein [Bacillota bacterium]